MTRETLLAHLASGSTTVCRAWTVRRRDGTVLGFTDHDRDVVIEGVVCRADSGLTARVLHQTTGLSVDNTEAYGALSSASISEADLLAGRFDGAEVRAFLVNWDAPGDHIEQFRGHIGEVSRSGGAFKAELRGLSERLNRPFGMAYTPGCSAVLGDSRCRFDLNQPGFTAEATVHQVDDGAGYVLAGVSGFDDHWFEGGRLEILAGAAAGLFGVVKNDRQENGLRRIDLWQSIGAEVIAGERVRLRAGCDKRPATCREKFSNFLNYRGFPHIPGEDWLASYPVPDRESGSVRRAGGSGT
ncbi:DUF2163 domain-containing protein [Rhodobacter calidifons]|uniref:DUF2163 domain-containing protein n=1 Tax=Rhodobacter calidifons TaxID=2715277 RepID=A0ABX0G9H6_9RHOB|nr:DUF2163 domain-containing protein [Rhodobacter calidifons]NHB77960.1 DUF2163 domain-containing protein [Rhodobacter calidifons]